MASQSVQNSFTKTFGIEVPIVSAPMAYAATPESVIAVIKGGGFGFLGAGNEPPERLVEDVEKVKSAIGPNKSSALGIGFVGWVLDRADPSKKHPLDAILETQIGAIWLAFGNDLAKYVKQIRAFDETRSHKTKIFVQVNTLEEAMRAAAEWMVDAIVVQGQEAGGRGSAYSPPLLAHVQSVLSSIPSGPFIIAAGGLTTGTHIASLLTLGASACVLGTRFLFTSECMWPQPMKSALVEAGLNETVRSSAFDIVFPPGVWPKGCEARCLKNRIMDDFEEKLEPKERKAHIDSKKEEYMVVYAGAGVGLVNKIQPCSEVMAELRTGLVETLKASQALLA